MHCSFSCLVESKMDATDVIVVARSERPRFAEPSARVAIDYRRLKDHLLLALVAPLCHNLETCVSARLIISEHEIR